MEKKDELTNLEKNEKEINKSNLRLLPNKISEKVFSHSQNISHFNQSSHHSQLPMIYSSQKVNNTSLFSASVQPRSFSATMQRMISSLNVEDNETLHRKNIERQIDSFRRYQDREEDIYLRTAFKHHKITGLGQRIKDNGVIEAIANAKNNEWRKLVLDDKMDPFEANEKTGVTAIGRIRTDNKYVDFFSTRASSFSRGISDQSESSKNVNNYQLPNEKKIINEARRERMKRPVLYWGCGNF